MAVPRRVLALILGGTLLFGALLFLLGLLVGSSLSTNTAVRPAPLPPVTLPPAPQPTVPVVPPVVPVPGGASGGPAPVPAPAGPAPAPAPPAPAKSGDAAPAAAAPAVKPVKVKGFGYGAPPSSQPASGLRGRLLEQAGVAPPDAATDPAAKPPAPPAAKEPPAAPLVFSVAVGRFLLEDNAARRLAEAQAKGFQPVLVVSDPPDPAGWLTVTLGPRGDAVQAGRLAEDASAQGFETALVSWLAP